MSKIWPLLIFCFFIFTPLFVNAQNFNEFFKIPIPGRIEGKGTHFEIKDSDYLNITLESEKAIEVVLESIPRIISLNIASSTEATTTLTLKSLEPNKKYFKYEDTHKNETEFFTDKNGSYSWQQDLTKPHHIWIQEIKGTIYIPEDCTSIIGTWNEEKRICTLAQDVTTSIEITTSSITLDCAGHSITGPGTDHGIYLNENVSGVTIKNCTTTNFSFGIYLNYSSNNTIVNNVVNNNWDNGIALNFSSYNSILNNTTNAHFDCGIRLYSSSNNTINNNTANYNAVYGPGAIWGGICLSFSSNNIIIGNTVNYNHDGIFLDDYSSNNIIINNIANYNYDGIRLYSSPENTIINNVTNNNTKGISLYYSPRNTVTNNTANYNYCGVVLFSSPDNVLTNNIANLNRHGICLCDSSNFNKISKNKISNNNETGIVMSNCDNSDPWGLCWWNGNSNNTIEFNEILNNKVGIFSQESSSTINRNVVCGNTDQDFYSDSWSLSSGDNNVCDKPDGWNDTGTTTGCKYSCSAIPIQKWSFDTDFQYNLDDDCRTTEGTGHSVGEVTLFAETLFVEGQVTIDGPLPTTTPNIYLIATDGLKRKSTSSEISFDLISYSQVATSTFSFSATIQNPILPINGGHYELYLEIDGKPFFINTNSKINKNYLPLIIFQNQLPIPIIEFSPKNPVKGVKVKFDASLSDDPDGEIKEFFWEIKRGEEILATSTAITTTFAFPANGEYQITLTATDNDGATSSTSTIIKVEPFSFAIITDLHIGRHYQEEYEGQDYYLTERLKKVVKWINENKDKVKCEENATCSIKFVAILGDITENTSLAGFCKVKEILDQLLIPYVPVFGNHDVGTDEEYGQCSKWKGQDYFDQVFWSTGSIPCQNATSTKNFELLLNELNFQRDKTNKDYKNFSFSFGGINFIGLDFVSREPFMKFGKGVGADAVLNEINKGWLEKKLEEFKGEPVILFAHHPLIFDPINAFSFTEFPQLENLLKDNITVFFDFAGHIHSFEEWHGKGWWVANANKKYTPIAFTNVLTTEALMVGSNGRGVEETGENGVVNGKKGIVRIVKVFEKDEIKPNSWETTERGDEFLAFNPSLNLGFSIRRQFNNIPCVELEAHKFSEKPSDFLWNFGGKTSSVDCNSDFSECLVCYEEGGQYEITLFAKDKNSNFTESISKKITVNEAIIPRTIKKSAELIEKGIEFISEKAQMSFDKIGQAVKDKVKIFKKKSPAIPVGEIIVHFENLKEDLDLSSLIVDTDFKTRKSILHMENWPQEVERSKVLFLPK
jgi:parallel beta-helix repeat protein